MITLIKGLLLIAFCCTVFVSLVRIGLIITKDT
jgi:hypothetical protein